MKNQRIVVAKEASKGCSIHVGAPIRVTLSPASKKVFELISACICIRRATSKNSRGSHRPTRPWRRPHFSPVHRENGPVFERTDSPLRLLELIRSHTSFAVSVSRAPPTRLQSSQAVVGNSAKQCPQRFSSPRPQSMWPRNAASCRAISRVTARTKPGAGRCPVSASDCATYSAED